MKKTQQPTMNRFGGRQVTGLTFIELLITLSILGIVLAMAVPSVYRQLVRSEVDRYANDVEMMLWLSKYTSIRIDDMTVVCFQTSGPICTSYRGVSVPGLYKSERENNGALALVKVLNPPRYDVQLKSSVQHLVFKKNGFAVIPGGAPSLTLNVCHSDIQDLWVAVEVAGSNIFASSKTGGGSSPCV